MSKNFFYRSHKISAMREGSKIGIYLPIYEKIKTDIVIF
jgi:hypothetical protein